MLCSLKSLLFFFLPKLLAQEITQWTFLITMLTCLIPWSKADQGKVMMKESTTAILRNNKPTHPHLKTFSLLWPDMIQITLLPPGSMVRTRATMSCSKHPQKSRFVDSATAHISIVFSRHKARSEDQDGGTTWFTPNGCVYLLVLQRLSMKHLRSRPALLLTLAHSPLFSIALFLPRQQDVYDIVFNRNTSGSVTFSRLKSAWSRPKKIGVGLRFVTTKKSPHILQSSLHKPIYFMVHHTYRTKTLVT